MDYVRCGTNTILWKSERPDLPYIGWMRWRAARDRRMGLRGFGATEGELVRQCTNYGGVWNLDTQTCDMSGDACAAAGGTWNPSTGECVVAYAPAPSSSAAPAATPVAGAKLGAVGWALLAAAGILGGAYLWSRR